MKNIKGRNEASSGSGRSGGEPSRVAGWGGGNLSYHLEKGERRKKKEGRERRVLLHLSSSEEGGQLLLETKGFQKRTRSSKDRSLKT